MRRSTAPRTTRFPVRYRTAKRHDTTYQELKERNHAYDTERVAKERHDQAKLRERRTEHRAQEQREYEQHEQYRRVPHDRAEGDDSDMDERAPRLPAVLVGERLDEHVRDCQHCGHRAREDDFAKQNCTPSSARYVTRKFLGRVAKFLLLVTGDLRT